MQSAADDGMALVPRGCWTNTSFEDRDSRLCVGFSDAGMTRPSTH